MTSDRRQIFAFSGILKSGDDKLTNLDLTNHALSLAGKGRGQRVCYVPTAVGDSPVAVEAKTSEFATQRPGVDFSVLTLFNQPSVPDIRKHLLFSNGFTTNSMTSLAAMKCLCLVTRSLDPTGPGRARLTVRWKPALNAFATTFADRWPAAETHDEHRRKHR